MKNTYAIWLSACTLLGLSKGLESTRYLYKPVNYFNN